MDTATDSVIIIQNLKLVHLSKKTRDFLERLNKFNEGDSFSIDELRNLYSNNKSLFFHVLNELSLYGCNFHSKKVNNLFPEDVTDESEILANNTEESFSPFELYKCKLWNLYNSYGFRYKKDFNGVFIDRLAYLTKNKDIKQRLIDIGFEIVVKPHKQDVVDEPSGKEENNEFCAPTYVVAPDFFLRIASFLMSCGSYVYSVLNKAGFYIFKDLLSLNNLECIYNLMENENSYLNGMLPSMMANCLWVPCLT